MTARIALIVLVMTVMACSLSVPVKNPPATKTPERLVMATVAAPVMTAEVTAYSLHVRQSAGHDKLVLGYLYQDDLVVMTGSCQDGWAQIRWNDGTAWVSARYLSGNSCQTKE
jgi:hypothetical protein